jgi:hypothetical protein
MSQSKTQPKPAVVGIPIKDRTPDDIRALFAGEEDAVVTQFLALHAYATREHLGITTLSHQTGIPGGVLSQAFNHVYPGDYSALAERIEKFFWRLQQKELYGGLRQFVETRLATTLWAIFEKTRVIRRIQIVASPEQLGKTRSAREYTARNNRGRTIYIRLSGGSRFGFGDFVWALAETLGIPYTIKLREKKIRIRQALESCDLIIIDEAHLVWAWCDSSAREFWDYLRTDLFADGERGIVLIATNSDMLDNLARFRRRAGYNVGQLLGRMRNEVLQIDPMDDVTAADVAALMARYYKPGAEAVRLLHDLAQREQLGHFGLVDDILNEAWTRSKARKRDLSDETVIAVAREIVSELKARKSLYQ